MVGRRAARPRAPGRAVRRPAAVRVRRGAGHAGRPLPERRLRRAAAAARLGPRRRHADRRGPARSGWPSPAAARSPTAGCSASSWSAGCGRGRKGRGGARVGELDEEMVYESRVGDVFTLGSTSWRIEDITHDRVLVSPAPGQPGRLPFWKGDALGRPAELGRAVGAFVREVAGLCRRARRRAAARRPASTPGRAANLLAYLREQRAATGHVPDDRTIVVERFRDELGDWRVVVHSPFGGQVHAPWALALGARLRERYGVDVQAMHADDGIVLRLPDTDTMLDGRPGARPDRRRCSCSTRTTSSRSSRPRSGGSALFAVPVPRVRGARPAAAPARPRPAYAAVAAAAALRAAAVGGVRVRLVPDRARDDARGPAGRLRRPGPRRLMRDIESRARCASSRSRPPSRRRSPRSLLFGYVGPVPLRGRLPARRAAGRRARARLRAARRAARAGRPARAPRRGRARRGRGASCSGSPRTGGPPTLEGVADLLRLLGPLTTAEAIERGATPHWLHELEAARRAIRVRIAGEERWAAIEDAGRLRDALGVAAPGRHPRGVPRARGRPARRPRRALRAYARPVQAGGRGPPARPRSRRRAGRCSPGWPRPAASSRASCARAAPAPSGATPRSCACSAAARSPRCGRRPSRSPPVALARFLPAWQSVGSTLRGPEGVLRVVEQLAGAAVPGVGARAAGAAGPGARLLPRLARRAHRRRRGRLGRPRPAARATTAGCRCTRRTWRRPRSLVDDAVRPAPTCRRACSTPLGDGAALFFRALSDRVGQADGAASTTRCSPPRSGSWSGPAG